MAMRRLAAWQWGGILLVSSMLAGVALAQTARTESERSRAWLGVYTQELTDDLRNALGIQANGVLISQVVKGSPAERGGLVKGDVIVTVNDRAVTSPDAFTETIQARKPGDVLAIRVLRDGERRTMSVTLGERSESSGSRDDDDDDGDDDDGDDDGDDDDESIRVEIPDADEIDRLVRKHVGDAQVYTFGSARGRLGVRIQDLNRDLGTYFKAPEGQGVLVLEVVDGSAAEKAGFRSGDVILKVGDDSVSDGDDLVRALREREGKVSIEILRSGTRRTLEAELEERRAYRWQGGPRAFAFDGDGRTMRIQGLDRDMERALRELRRELEDLRRELRELSRD
jgi:predicted metalloprotease with PDZ domain